MTPSLLPLLFPSRLPDTRHTSHMFVGLQLVLIRRYDALNARGIYYESRHLTSQGVPGTEAETGITIRRLVRKAENSFCPSSHAVAPCPSTFKQIPAEGEVNIGVADIQLIIAKLSSETTRHVGLDHT